jgi:ACS family hexuronate transporter-like MFS transporter
MVGRRADLSRHYHQLPFAQRARRSCPDAEGPDGISTEEYSYIVGAFQLGYTVMQPVCGMVVDLIGLRLGFALFAALWSIAGCLQGGVTGWLSLAGARGLMGLTEAAAIPAGMKAVAEWFPDKEKSIAVGFFNVGTSFGALIAPPLVGAITLTLGWRTAFVVTGAVGFFWAALWYAFYRSPSEYGLLLPSERAQILSGQTRPDRSRPKPSVRELLATRRFWAIAIPRFFAEPAWQTFSFWIPLYLATERHMDLKQIALFAWLPFLAADFGGVFGGFIAPFLMKTLGVTLVWSRIWGVVLGALMMIGPASIGLVASPYVAIALLCLGGFAHQTISVLVNTLSADLFDSREVCTVSGFAGMAAWTGELGFSLLVGALADTLGYGPLFGLLGVSTSLGGAALIILIGGERHAERFAAA